MGSPRTRTSSRQAPAVAPFVARSTEAPKLLHVIDHVTVRTENGEELRPVTRMDRILQYLESNAPFRDAAVAAGVDASTLQQWRRDGAEAMVKLAARREGAAPKAKLTKREKVLVEFVQRIDEVIARRHVRAAGSLTKLAEGGFTQETVTEKKEFVHVPQPDGTLRTTERVVERKRVSSTAAPNAAALTLLLRSRWPDDWAQTERVEVTGQGGGPVRVEASVVHETVNRLAEKIAKREALAAAAVGDDGVVDAEVISDSADPAAHATG